jgi:hypothetical protein
MNGLVYSGADRIQKSKSLQREGQNSIENTVATTDDA